MPGRLTFGPQRRRRRQAARAAALTALTTITALAALTLSATGCGGEGGGGGEGDGGGGTDGAGAMLHPGPCSAAMIGADGVRHEGFLTWSYDGAGRMTEERRADDEAATGVPVWLQKNAYDADGMLVQDTFTTTAPEPDHDWTFTYGADGRPTTRVGTQTGYGKESCIYEWSTVPEAPDDFSLICDFSYDTFDDDGNRTGTVVGRYGIHHTFGDLGGGKRRERVLYDDAEGGTPDKEVSRFYDADGRLERIETDASFRGYAEHIVYIAYDAAGRVSERKTDDDGDGTIDLIEALVRDEAGNVERVETDEGADGNVDRRWEMSYACWS